MGCCCLDKLVKTEIIQLLLAIEEQKQIQCERACTISWQTNLLWYLAIIIPKSLVRIFEVQWRPQSSANRHIRKQLNSCWPGVQNSQLSTNTAVTEQHTGWEEIQSSLLRECKNWSIQKKPLFFQKTPITNNVAILISINSIYNQIYSFTCRHTCMTDSFQSYFLI